MILKLFQNGGILKFGNSLYMRRTTAYEDPFKLILSCPDLGGFRKYDASLSAKKLFSHYVFSFYTNKVKG